MESPSQFTLPGTSDWSFTEIAVCDQARAETLDTAASPNELIAGLSASLTKAFESDDVRFGWEHAQEQPEDSRAVVQFPIGTTLFDWFFNARTGYRAHFRAGVDCGLEFNDQIIGTLAEIIVHLAPDPVSCREISFGCEDHSAVLVARQEFLRSFVADGSLAKIWFCTHRICANGGFEQMTSGVVGPKIVIGSETRWAAPSRENEHAWLDIKGAFLGREGPYQLKDPIGRAKKLAATGEA